MFLQFRIGDKVILKKDRINATVLLSIGDRKVKIQDEYGFEYIVLNSELILLNNINDSDYGTSFVIKDVDKVKEVKKRLYTNKKDSRGKVFIDLHIEQLTQYHHHMQNYEIIKTQMDYCKEELDSALFKGKESLEITHGIGEGVLKAEVHKLLKLYNITYFESNNGGSTQAIL